MRKAIREALEDCIYRLRNERDNQPEMYARLFPTLGDLLHTVRIDLDEVREQLADVPAIEATPVTTLEGIREYLEIARMGLMQFGATDAQIALIARRAVEDDISADRICGSSGLSKQEASAILANW